VPEIIKTSPAGEEENHENIPNLLCPASEIDRNIDFLKKKLTEGKTV